MSVEASVNQRLAALTAAGTSILLDQISRGLITSGELERLVEADSLRGVTSNPAIFEKAILGSSDYEEQVAQLADLLVVVLRAEDRLLEDRRVRGHAAQRVLAHEPLQLTARDQAALDLVEPDARAGRGQRGEPLVRLRPDAHAVAPSRSRTARPRAATFSAVKPKCW